MDWIGPTVAIVAALFAGWQAWEARRARSDAKKSAVEAHDYEQRAVDASERIASAIEEQNERERAAADEYETPFALGQEYVSTPGSKRWRLELQGTETVHDVSIEIEPRDPHFKIRPETVPATMQPGAVVLFDWWRGGAAPDFISLTVRWTRANGETHHARKELH